MTRRDLLKLTASATLARSLLRGESAAASAPSVQEQPRAAMNILYLHCHDAGRVLSPYQPAIPTPALQRFGAEAFRFTNAHSAAPTCSPSRAAMLTGVSSHECGM